MKATARTPTFNIQEWHHCFREATGHDTTLDFYRESMWTEFLRYMMKVRPDFCMADLRAVIANRKRREKLREQGKWSVAFNAVVGSPWPTARPIALPICREPWSLLVCRLCDAVLIRSLMDVDSHSRCVTQIQTE